MSNPKLTVLFITDKAVACAGVVPCIPQIGSHVTDNLTGIRYTVAHVSYETNLHCGSAMASNVAQDSANDLYEPNVAVSLVEVV
jgi:hypothetical protein